MAVTQKAGTRFRYQNGFGKILTATLIAPLTNKREAWMIHLDGDREGYDIKFTLDFHRERLTWL